MSGNQRTQPVHYGQIHSLQWQPENFSRPQHHPLAHYASTAIGSLEYVPYSTRQARPRDPQLAATAASALEVSDAAAGHHGARGEEGAGGAQGQPLDAPQPLRWRGGGDGGAVAAVKLHRSLDLYRRVPWWTAASLRPGRTADSNPARAEGECGWGTCVGSACALWEEVTKLPTQIYIPR